MEERLAKLILNLKQGTPSGVTLSMNDEGKVTVLKDPDFSVGNGFEPSFSQLVEVVRVINEGHFNDNSDTSVRKFLERFVRTLTKENPFEKGRNGISSGHLRVYAKYFGIGK